MADGVLLTADAAQRMAAATRKVERMGADVPGDSWYPYVPDEAEGLKLCKTAATWAKDTTADLDEYTGTPGSEKAATPPVKVKAWNKLGAVDSGKWVLVGQVGGEWYLLATEPKEVEVITGVSLGSSGLTFTKKTLLVYGTKTPDPASVVISTQACP
jgi:hypothetical protein